MIILTLEQKQSLGFQYLLDDMQPNCIYGQELVKNAAPASRGEQQELQEELKRLSLLVEGYEKHRSFWDSMELILMQMKEVRGSLKRGAEVVLTDLELFELKHFLLQWEKLQQLFRREDAVLLPGIAPEDTVGALDLLDPQGRRLPGFYLVDEYAEDLRQVREQKRHLEVVLRQEHEEKKKERLLRQRQEEVAKEEEISQRIRGEITEELRPWLNRIAQNCDVVGKLDFLIQKAKLALRYKGICPTLTQEELKLENMRHPAIEKRLSESQKFFTPISFQMEPGAAVITGANMGGKSVALRTVALNVILAQSGFFVYATEARVPLFDTICMVAEEYQSMQNGLSSFGGEIMQLQNAINAQKEGFGLLVFDELARGTNPDEGTSIVRAVVRYLKERHVMAILATHYDNVAEFADYHYQVAGLNQVDMKQLEEEIHSAKGTKGIDIISKYMNYGIYQVHGKEECPRDAIHICGLLGLEPELMELILKE